MNVKNFNPFERHVEKITLAVAAAGAAYMIWMAYPPTLTIEQGGQQIAAEDVEAQVSKAVEDLEAARERTRRLGKIPVTVPDLQGEYLARNRDKPLADVLVKGEIPRFGPPQVRVEEAPDTEINQWLAIATPKVPGATDLSAVAGRGVVVVGPLPPAGAAAPPPVPAQGVPQDVDLVLVKGVVDLGKLMEQMANPALAPNQRLPAGFQRAVVYRIEAQKRKRESGGAWGEWQPVTNKAAQPIEITWDKVRDEDLQTTVNNLEAAVKQITQPEYFPEPNGASVVQDLLAGRTSWGGVAPGTGMPGVGPAAGVPGAVPPRMPPAAAGSASWGVPEFADDGPRAGTSGIRPPGPGPAPAPMPAAAGGAPAAPGAAVPSTAIPFWVLDDGVQSGQEYQYRVRVVMYNPTYRWPHLLQEPAMKDKPVITGEWVAVAAPVVVQSSMYFFITDGKVGSRVNAQVFRWKAGKWFMTDVTVPMGTPVVATGMRVAPPGPGPVPTEDVDTGYMLVDIVQNTANGEITAVLMNNKGELITRDARLEQQDPKRRELIKLVQEGRPPVVPTTRSAPTPRPAGPMAPRPGPFDERNPDLR